MSNLKDKTRKELAARLETLEKKVNIDNLGSKYLKKHDSHYKRNLALIVGGATAVLGVAAWSLLQSES